MITINGKICKLRKGDQVLVTPRNGTDPYIGEVTDTQKDSSRVAVAAEGVALHPSGYGAGTVIYRPLKSRVRVITKESDPELFL